MATVEESLAMAIRHHQAGDLRTAERVYREILRRDPRHADAYHMLGVTAHQQGDHQRAVDLIQTAIAIHPNFAAFHCNLGIAFKAQGKLDDAVASYRRALHFTPGYAAAHCNLGNALKAQGNLDQAIDCFRRALELNPRSVEAHSNLGAALRNLGRLSEALASCRRALELKPNYAEAHLNLGNTLRDQGRLDEAMAALEQAQVHRPDYADAHWNRALILLVKGQFDSGWEEYEWRWRLPQARPRDFACPKWNGHRQARQTILIHAEQGMGDTIQFARYLPKVKELAGTVVFECQRPLVKLMTGAHGADRVIAKGDPLPCFDTHIPLLSLAQTFRTTLHSIPNTVPYLYASSELQVYWERELSTYPGFRVGICWQGNPCFPGDRQRSIPLRHFTPLASIPHVQLISLQKENGIDQMSALRDVCPVVDLSERLADFTDTAAIMMNLDLVVTSDTSVAHLAGALGVPVWLATPFAADWRWLLDREDSPWYPTMRLFRQREFGSWDTVFDQIAGALGSRTECGRRPKQATARGLGKSL